MELIPLVILSIPAFFRLVVFLPGKNEVFGWFWCHSDRVTVLLLRFGNVYSLLITSTLWTNDKTHESQDEKNQFLRSY